jgi:arylsulfatase A
MRFPSILGVVLLLAFAASGSQAASPPPNIVLVLVDDLGATDLGLTGSRLYETPHIDRLAREGMQFKVAYSACTVCSPTRASLLTGKNPAALRVTDWIAGHNRPNAKLLIPEWTKELRPEEVTLAELLREKGYATASIGKWHLGPNPPEAHGFDLNLGGTERGQPPSYFSPYKIPTLADGPPGEFLTDRLAAEVGKFIETNKGRPFFVYLPDFAVHTPIMGKKEVIEKYRAKAKEGGDHMNPAYAALVESVDDSVGRIRAKLDELGLTERTVFIFTSDNGGLLGGARQPVTTNLGLRAGKGSAYEGGVRIPMVWNWPGVTKPGSVSDVPVITGDIFHTLLEIAGVPPRSNPEYASLVPLLKGGGTLPARQLYWHYPHYHPGGATPYSAIRDGDWRLIEFYEDGRLELYNLAADPEEKEDLSTKEPARVATLRGKLEEWRRSVNAQEPTANPAFIPGRAANAGAGAARRKAATEEAAPAGFIQLHARDARISGEKLRFEAEPAKDTLGYWVNPADSASWDFEVLHPGQYQVQVLQACGKGSDGSVVEIAVGEQKIDFKVHETGHFQSFRPVDAGVIELGAGTTRLTVTPRSKPGGAVMDLRRISLIRVP